MKPIPTTALHRFITRLRRGHGWADTTAESTGSLSATNSVVKACRALGEELDACDRKAAAAFVDACGDGSGGYAQVAGGDPDAFATASALIVFRELGDEARLAAAVPGALAYLEANAISQFDHFMTIAAYEECDFLPAQRPAKAVAYFEAKAEGGVYGEGVLENAIAAASLCRAGEPVADRDAVVSRLLAGQLADGGFGDGDDADLMTTYCVLRAAVLLEFEPDTRSLLGYLDTLATTEGFGREPGGPTSVGASYMVLAIREYLAELQRRAVDLARAGDVEGITTWLRAGGHPDLRDDDGWTVLLAAASRGQAKAVERLLHPEDPAIPPADPEQRFELADALPIYMAGQAGDVETARQLLAVRPQHLHAISRVNGHTVLLQASFYGKAQHQELARYLLDEAWKPCSSEAAATCDRQTAAEGDRRAEQLRLTTATNVRGYTARSMQELWNNQDMAKLLDEYPQPNDRQKASYLDDLLLSVADPQALTERLIEYLGVWQGRANDLPPETAEGEVAGLIEQGLAAIDRILAQPACEIDRLGSALYQSPLVFAITGVDRTMPAATMRRALVGRLLDAGADPKVVERHPMAIGAVIRASVLGQFGLLQLLASHMEPDAFAAEMNVSPTVNGLTALHDAIHRALTAEPSNLDQRLEQARWMMERGARSDIPDHTGQTQRQLALEAADAGFPPANVDAVRGLFDDETPAPAPEAVA
ncbi:MAG: hypothetical protein AAFX65_07285 [Cyanobacteria bacterium J06638_7]